MMQQPYDKIRNLLQDDAHERPPPYRRHMHMVYRESISVNCKMNIQCVIRPDPYDILQFVTKIIKMRDDINISNQKKILIAFYHLWFTYGHLGYESSTETFFLNGTVALDYATPTPAMTDTYLINHTQLMKSLTNIPFVIHCTLKANSVVTSVKHYSAHVNRTAAYFNLVKVITDVDLQTGQGGISKEQLEKNNQSTIYSLLNPSLDPSYQATMSVRGLSNRMSCLELENESFNQLPFPEPTAPYSRQLTTQEVSSTDNQQHEHAKVVRMATPHAWLTSRNERDPDQDTSGTRDSLNTIFTYTGQQRRNSR
nr:TPA_asm: hypothetical protein [Microrhabdovirus]